MRPLSSLLATDTDPDTCTRFIRDFNRKEKLIPPIFEPLRKGGGGAQETAFGISSKWPAAWCGNEMNGAIEMLRSPG